VFFNRVLTSSAGAVPGTGGGDGVAAWLPASDLAIGAAAPAVSAGAPLDEAIAAASSACASLVADCRSAVDESPPDSLFGRDGRVLFPGVELVGAAGVVFTSGESLSGAGDCSSGADAAAA
jgi:hypothetical protein